VHAAPYRFRLPLARRSPVRFRTSAASRGNVCAISLSIADGILCPIFNAAKESFDGGGQRHIREHHAHSALCRWDRISAPRRQIARGLDAEPNGPSRRRQAATPVQSTYRLLNAKTWTFLCQQASSQDRRQYESRLACGSARKRSTPSNLTDRLSHPPLPSYPALYRDQSAARSFATLADKTRPHCIMKLRKLLLTISPPHSDFCPFRFHFRACSHF